MRHPVAPSFGTESPATLLGGQFRQRRVKIGGAVQPFRLAVVAEQASLLQHVLVVVEDDRVDIERDGILLAVRSLRRLPVGGPEIARLDARRGEFFRSDRAQRASRDAERHPRFMIGHDIRALPRRRRGLHLGVERDAPFERGRIDVNLAVVLLVELVEHRFHADAVAAAEEIPPDDGFGCVRRADCQRRAGQGRVQDFADHLDFLPKMTWRLPASQAAGSEIAPSESLASEC